MKGKQPKQPRPASLQLEFQRVFGGASIQPSVLVASRQKTIFDF